MDKEKGRSHPFKRVRKVNGWLISFLVNALLLLLLLLVLLLSSSQISIYTKMKTAEGVVSCYNSMPINDNVTFPNSNALMITYPKWLYQFPHAIRCNLN